MDEEKKVDGEEAADTEKNPETSGEPVNTPSEDAPDDAEVPAEEAAE